MSTPTSSFTTSKEDLEGGSLGFGVRPLYFFTGQDGRKLSMQGVKVENGEFTRYDDITFEESTDIGEVARAAVLVRVYALGDFKTNTRIGCMEQQEAKSPDKAQLVLGCGKFLFVIEANIVCAEAIRVLVGDTPHFRRVDLRKWGRHTSIRSAM